MSARRLSTRANLLTALRLLAAPALWAAVSSRRPLLAAVCFWLAVATDFADGWVARRFGEASPFGGLADHTADAAFVATGAAALARAGVLPVLLAPLIAAAFLQYALDSRLVAAPQGLRRSSLGRWNGIAYYVVVAIPLMRDALGFAWPGAGTVRGLGWALVASTLLSMLDRLRWLLAVRRSRGSPV